MVLIIFPEGGRSLDGTVQEFRRGATILARNLSVPTAPVGIWGAYSVWPREGRFRRHPVAIDFGAPLTPGDADSDDAFTDQLREEVARLVREAALMPSSSPGVE